MPDLREQAFRLASEFYDRLQAWMDADRAAFPTDDPVLRGSLELSALASVVAERVALSVPNEEYLGIAVALVHAQVAETVATVWAQRKGARLQ